MVGVWGVLKMKEDLVLDKAGLAEMCKVRTVWDTVHSVEQFSLGLILHFDNPT